MNALKHYRLMAELTQGQLAEKSGISRVTIGKIERNEEQDLRVTTLVALADALGCAVTDLLC